MRTLAWLLARLPAHMSPPAPPESCECHDLPIEDCPALP